MLKFKLKRAIAVAMDLSATSFSQKTGKQPTNKARLRSLLPQILNLREQGYYLSDIYRFLRESEAIDCRLESFYRQINNFRKDPDLKISDRSIIQEPYINQGTIAEEAAGGRIGDDYNISQSSRLAELLSKKIK